MISCIFVVLRFQIYNEHVDAVDSFINSYDLKNSIQAVDEADHQDFLDGSFQQDTVLK